MAFDSTLGFPGEGPHIFCLSGLLAPPLSFMDFVPWILAMDFVFPVVSLDFGIRAQACRPSPAVVVCPLWSAAGLPWVASFFPCFAACPGSWSHAANAACPGWESQSVGERRKTWTMRGGTNDGGYSESRERYWNVFLRWSAEEGYHANVDEIHCLMIKHGRVLYAVGKSCNQYAETLNSLTTRKPGLRRLLTAAWDLGYAWTSGEPSQHHIPLPVLILLGMTTVSLMWGWLRMAGILALGFGGLLRPGEIVSALRSGLLLPRDSGFSANLILLSTREPKSRFTYAKQQTAKVDSQDLVAIIDLAFRDMRRIVVCGRTVLKHCEADSSLYWQLWNFQRWAHWGADALILVVYGQVVPHSSSSQLRMVNSADAEADAESDGLTSRWWKSTCKSVWHHNIWPSFRRRLVGTLLN